MAGHRMERINADAQREYDKVTSTGRAQLAAGQHLVGAHTPQRR